ncbi:hypothetical protein SAMN05443249_5930 [Beijerinckia sp. 28-YEA-48]|nr:hypothetical protein SAMN05443249_5930 [Beijerinckia sp. 28-YEA-48]
MGDAQGAIEEQRRGIGRAQIPDGFAEQRQLAAEMLFADPGQSQMGPQRMSFVAIGAPQGR